MFTRPECDALAKAVAAAGGKEAYCLAWEFEMELRQHCLAVEAETRVKLKLVPIPREIMERNRTKPPPFLEMAVLEAEAVLKAATSGRGSPKAVDVKLTKFLPSLAGQRGLRPRFRLCVLHDAPSAPPTRQTTVPALRL